MTINPLRTGDNSMGIRSAVSPQSIRQVILSPAGIVFFGGTNLILVQWVLVREMTALLLGTELVVLLVSIAYFAGLSLGYGLAGRVKRSWLVPLGAATLILHLTLPVWFRLLVAGLDSIGAYAAAFLILPLLTPFIISAFYSLFLPIFADNGEGQVAGLYGAELLGSGAGVLLLVALGGMGLVAVEAIYSLGLLLILAALGVRLRLIAALAVAAALWLTVLPGINAWSNSLWYQTLHGLPTGTRTLFTGYSPYQKVDVLETPEGVRYLYLDGLNHFGTYDGQRLNVVSGQIPASLIQPQNALVFGAGSMQMAAMIADHAGTVRTVEIDPLVVEVSTRYFLEFNRLNKLANRTITVDDAKHYIANSAERYDFIATDLPAAYSIQTATLYSEPFFAEIARHMNPGGVFVANLTSEFTPDDEVSRRIAAGLLATFDEVMVITPESVGWSFAYASDDLPFDRAAIETALHDSGESQFVLYETPAVRAFVGKAQPITLDSMDIVLHVSWDWVKDRLDG
jgi:spermidine synthase